MELFSCQFYFYFYFPSVWTIEKGIKVKKISCMTLTVYQNPWPTYSIQLDKTVSVFPVSTTIKTSTLKDIFNIK